MISKIKNESFVQAGGETMHTSFNTREDEKHVSHNDSTAYRQRGPRMNFEKEQKLAMAVPGYVEYVFNM